MQSRKVNKLKVTAAEIQYTAPPWAKTLTDIFPTEILILMAITMIILLIIGSLVAKRKRAAEGLTKTRISLLVGNSHTQYLIHWGEAMFQPDLYEIAFKQTRPIKVSLKLRATWGGNFGNELKLTNASIALKNTKLPFTSHLDNTINITWSVARKIKKLIRHDFFISIVLSDRFGRVNSSLPIRPQSASNNTVMYNNKGFTPTAPSEMDSEADLDISAAEP
jgi:hypothetical protein